MPAIFKERTADLIHVKDIALDLLIGAIECDDISTLTTTPKSVLDRSGRSGSSFMEMIDFIESRQWSERPRCVLLECVASLDKMRKSINEKGTQAVTAKMADLGYIGEWQTCNTCKFGIPQSRTRSYGIYTLLTRGFAAEGKQHHTAQVKRMWALVRRFQLPNPDLLQHFFEKMKIEQDDVGAKKFKAVKDRGAAKKPAGKEPKWLGLHERFKKKHGLQDSDLNHPPQKMLKNHQQTLRLTDREVEAVVLRMGLQLRKKALDHKCMVGNIGDSVNYIRLSSSLHPCVLPSKKYIYFIGERCLVNQNCGNLYMMLQGLGPEEMAMSGLDSVEPRQNQELAGNAFTSNVIAAMILAVLCHWNVA